MAIFFIVVTNLLNLFQRILLMHKLVSVYWANKIQWILKEKIAKISFYQFYSEAQDEKLEKICHNVFKLEALSIMAIRNQAHF